MASTHAKDGDAPVQMRRQRLADLSRALPRPERLTESARQRLDTWGERLPAALRGGVARRRVALSDAGGSLRPAVLQARIGQERQKLADRGGRLPVALSRAVMQGQRDLDRLSARQVPDLLRRPLAKQRADFDRLAARFASVAAQGVARHRDRLAALERMRLTLGYEATLERGYAVVKDGNGAVMTRRAQAAAAEALTILFADGALELGASDTPSPQETAAKPARAPKKPAPPEQGSLF